MHATIARRIAFAMAVLASWCSSAIAEDAIKTGEHRNPEQSESCTVFGPGYFKLAGTETCIKIGGSVRIDVGAGDLENGHRNNGR